MEAVTADLNAALEERDAKIEALEAANKSNVANVESIQMMIHILKSQIDLPEFATDAGRLGGYFLQGSDIAISIDILQGDRTEPL